MADGAAPRISVTFSSSTEAPVRVTRKTGGSTRRLGDSIFSARSFSRRTNTRGDFSIFSRRSQSDDELQLDLAENVGLEIELLKEEPGKAKVSGPFTAVMTLKTLLGKSRDEHVYVDHAPLGKVMIPREQRTATGVPEDAEHCCFVYPHQELSQLSNDLRFGEGKRDEPWFDLLLGGGFAYFDTFDGKDRLLRTNALIDPPAAGLSAARLQFDGPYPLERDSSLIAFIKAGRMAPVDPNGVLPQRYINFGYVHENEGLVPIEKEESVASELLQSDSFSGRSQTSPSQRGRKKSLDVLRSFMAGVEPIHLEGLRGSMAEISTAEISLSDAGGGSTRSILAAP
jgi:hypothetical protein